MAKRRATQVTSYWLSGSHHLCKIVSMVDRTVDVHQRIQHGAFNHHSREFNTNTRDQEDRTATIGLGSLAVAINVIGRTPVTITRRYHYPVAVLSFLLSIYVEWICKDYKDFDPS